MRVHPSTERAIRIYHRREKLSPRAIASRLQLTTETVCGVLGLRPHDVTEVARLRILELYAQRLSVPVIAARVRLPRADVRMVIRDHGPERPKRRLRCAYCNEVGTGRVKDNDNDWCCAPGTGCAKGM